MFKGQDQTTLLSPMCCPLIYFNPLLTCLDRICFYREDKAEFYTKGGIYVSETFLVFSWFLLNATNWMLFCNFGARDINSSKSAKVNEGERKRIGLLTQGDIKVAAYK